MSESSTNATGSGTSQAAPAAKAASGTQPAQGIDPELAAKIAAVRAHVRESFGKIAMAMMMLPRYRHQTVADLQHLILEPLVQDRIAIAYPAGAAAGPLADMAGLAIWASVSDEVDATIREQIKAGTFPVRLKAADWRSGSNHWLLDVIAPDRAATARVIANFRQVLPKVGEGNAPKAGEGNAPKAGEGNAPTAGDAKDAGSGSLRLHPLVARMLDEETLKKMGAQKGGG